MHAAFMSDKSWGDKLEPARAPKTKRNSKGRRKRRKNTPRLKLYILTAHIAPSFRSLDLYILAVVRTAAAAARGTTVLADAMKYLGQYRSGSSRAHHLRSRLHDSINNREELSKLKLHWYQIQQQ